MVLINFVSSVGYMVDQVHSEIFVSDSYINFLLIHEVIKLGYQKGKFLVYCLLALVLFGLGSTYSYVTIYYDTHLGLPNEPLSMPMCVDIYIKDSLLMDHVYRSCFVTI